jgi:hypothetical protein
LAVQTSPPAAAAGSQKAPVVKRTDNWWGGTLFFFIVFSAFGAWATFRAFQNGFYETAGASQFGGAYYLSPLYSPTLRLSTKIAGFNISPALFILPFPLCFRLSCYYYRKMLYRAYGADPLGCAIAEPEPLASMRRKKYKGEKYFPLVVQNFHRYAFFAAAIFIIMLWKDTIEAFFFKNGDSMHFGMGLGSIIFLANVILLSCYTFSCHSWRHFVGGNADCYSCSVLNQTKHGLWKKISFINEKHGTFAMASLISVALTDVYVFLVTSGHFHDIRFF